MKLNALLLVFFLMMESAVNSQIVESHEKSPSVHFSPEDLERFHEYIQYIEPYANAPFGTLMEKTALFFLGSPYVAHTLEVSDEEMLVVNLQEFDCVTFIETVIALANTVHFGKNDFDDYAAQLQRVRYRDGNLNGYTSRLHYTSEWVHNNQKKGVLINISKEIGGQKEEKKINFMSTHRESYKQLKTNDNLWQEIKEIEGAINERGGFYFLPKSQIASVEASIPHMAMIGFTTSIKGLDTTHTGFAFHQDGRLTFIHASSLKDQVVIDEKTLHDYCQGQSSCNGIIVAKVQSNVKNIDPLAFP